MNAIHGVDANISGQSLRTGWWIVEHTAEEILEALRGLLRQECGPDITLREFRQVTGISGFKVYDRWGTWTKLRVAAGLPRRMRAPVIYTVDELLREFHMASLQLEHYPTVAEFGQISRRGWGTLQQRFGSKPPRAVWACCSRKGVHARGEPSSWPSPSGRGDRAESQQVGDVREGRIVRQECGGVGASAGGLHNVGIPFNGNGHLTTLFTRIPCIHRRPDEHHKETGNRPQNPSSRHEKAHIEDSHRYDCTEWRVCQHFEPLLKERHLSVRLQAQAHHGTGHKYAGDERQHRDDQGSNRCDRHLDPQRFQCIGGHSTGRPLDQYRARSEDMAALKLSNQLCPCRSELSFTD